MNNNIDWIIHLVANGACDECGKEEKGFLPYTCNAHTHGMEKLRKCGTTQSPDASISRLISA